MTFMMSWLESFPLSSGFGPLPCPPLTISDMEIELPGTPLTLSVTFFERNSRWAACWSRLGSSFFSGYAAEAAGWEVEVVDELLSVDAGVLLGVAAGVAEDASGDEVGVAAGVDGVVDGFAAADAGAASVGVVDGVGSAYVRVLWVVFLSVAGASLT